MNSKLAFLIFILALIQGIQSYCVYNMMSDDSSFYVHQTSGKAVTSSLFKKKMEKNAKECCPYTSWSCSSRPLSNDETYFSIEFDFANGHKAFPFGVKCTSGGGLSIHGNQDKYWAECTRADGTTSLVNFFREILS